MPGPGRSSDLSEDDDRGAPEQDRYRRCQRQRFPERQRVIDSVAELEMHEPRLGLPAFYRPLVRLMLSHDVLR